MKLNAEERKRKRIRKTDISHHEGKVTEGMIAIKVINGEIKIVQPHQSMEREGSPINEVSKVQILQSLQQFNVDDVVKGLLIKEE